MEYQTSRRVWFAFSDFTVQCPRNLRIIRVIVMAMAVSRDATLALTVSADHLVGRYDLMVSFHDTCTFPDL
jgi:hypothetical protein